jgi:hypothetical protein
MKYAVTDTETFHEPKQGFGQEWKQRRIICWDGEGMNLRGEGKPQNYVLFGCSAETETPLVGRVLNAGHLLNYMCEVSEKYPGAVHVAYSFKYDFNMIIQTLGWQHKLELKNTGSVTVDGGWASCPESWGYRYFIKYTPGKIFELMRQEKEHRERKVRIRIDDVFSFFGCSFIKACESILQDDISDLDREVIEHGKKDRGHNLWEDLAEVREYWTAEIRLMERMVERFREVMYQAGFKLTQWYGPGALANYIIRTRKLKHHIQNTPDIKEVHNASKHAYTGGRFELFQFGRIHQPVYGIDRNSAYPYALRDAPSLGQDHGSWRHQELPTSISEFAVYRISFSHQGPQNPLHVYTPMPLFHRDHKGSISYPPKCEGWYWSPEARMVQDWGRRYGGVVIHEGWVWEHDGTRPFNFLGELYDERQRLGKKNVLSIPYKLGPNCIYGKLAQRVGGKEKPPPSHCLPLAGWITSHCRAALFNIMVQIPQGQLVAVETDGIYTTLHPDRIKMRTGDALGEWGVDVYDEMLYLQNGIYGRRSGSEWLTPKSRGVDSTSVPTQVLRDYFQQAGPGVFPGLEVQMKPRFVGLSAAMVGDPEKVNERHCVWYQEPKVLQPAATGKRVHLAGCPVCREGLSAWERPHPLAVLTRAGFDSPLMSAQHTLPWEGKENPRTLAAREHAVREGDLLS